MSNRPQQETDKTHVKADICHWKVATISN